MLYIYNFIKNKYIEFALVFCTVCGLILTVIKLVLVFSYHPDISGSERSTIFGIQQAGAGLPVYRSPEEFPFWLLNYSSAYFYITGWISRLLGWDASNAHRIYFLSRFVSMTFVFCSLGIAYKTLRQFITLDIKRSLTVVLVLMGLIQYWHLTNSRIDSLLLLCTVSCIYFLFKSFESSDDWNSRLLIATIISAFAPFAKQSGLILFIVIAAYLLWRRSFRAFLFSLAVWSLSVGVFIMLFGFPDIQIFFDNVFGSLVVPLSLSWYYHFTFIKLFTITNSLVAVSFLIAAKWIITDSDKLKQFLGLSVFIFFGFATATTMKQGSGVGYFHEFAYSAFLMLSLYFMGNTGLKKAYNDVWVIVIGCLSMFYFTVQQAELCTSYDFMQYENDYSDQRIVKEYITPLIKESEGIVVLSNGERQRGAYLQHMLFKNILAVQDDVTYFTYMNKYFNYDRFFEMVAEKKIRYLIMDRQDVPYFSAFNYTFNLNDYKLEKELGGFFIYAHK